MISSGTTMRFLAPEGPRDLRTEYRFRTADPYAVELCFPTGSGDAASWVLGRDLLAEGLLFEVGEGDVHIRPVGAGYLSVALYDRQGAAAVLLAPRRDLEQFLARAYQTVPPGAEGRWADWDDFIHQLLAGSSDRSGGTSA